MMLRIRRKKAKDSAGKVVDDVKDKAKDAAGKAKDAAGKKVEEGKDAVKAKAGEVKDAAEDASGDLFDAAGNVIVKAAETLQTAGEFAFAAGSAAYEAAGGYEGIKETLGHVADAAREKLGQAADAMGATDKLNQAKEAVAKQVNKIPGAKATMDAAGKAYDATLDAAEKAGHVVMEKVGGMEGLQEKMEVVKEKVIEKAGDFAGVASEKLKQMRTGSEDEGFEDGEEDVDQQAGQKQKAKDGSPQKGKKQKTEL